MATVRRKIAKRSKAAKRAKPTRKPTAIRLSSREPKSGKRQPASPKSGTAKLKYLLRAAEDRQSATADILKVIASSLDDVQPVFAAIAASANKLLGGFSTAVFRFIDDIAHLAAFTPTTPAADNVLQS